MAQSAEPRAPSLLAAVSNKVQQLTLKRLSNASSADNEANEGRRKSRTRSRALLGPLDAGETDCRARIDPLLLLMRM